MLRDSLNCGSQGAANGEGDDDDDDDTKGRGTNAKYVRTVHEEVRNQSSPLSPPFQSSVRGHSICRVQYVCRASRIPARRCQ